ncbi:DNA-binding transcriptional regulator, MarR family [Streptosporangium subroseum]|uniref:DNA-binding transcriptional regulator, MarR family n=1 Tax=Streptosporangium subroseum TaxID=106412 RepID=A0A239PDI8_9ACTN|nr:MarR family transcriptional regulator [Streptosporangium subroseum]SNT64704.1 DNA-binding transcriptional regulator, MarR family [Streptosporangium subroseum]
MSSVQDGARWRRQQIRAVKEALRDLNIQLSLLNRQFGARVELKDADWDCLDLINRQGPLSPSALARVAGLHPATLTGVLDRLQRGGWIVRERDPDATDRRAVTVRARRERNAELYRLFSGMNAQMDQLCEDYTDAELELIADFLRRTTTAGNTATDELSSG